MFNKKDNNQLLIMFVSMFSIFFIFKYRYKVINLVLGTRWIRRAVVSGVLQIPIVRDRFLQRFMPF